MIFKITRFLPALVLLCLTVFAIIAFSTNHTIDAAWKESESDSIHVQHYGSVFVGDPVGGGGTPCGGNQTLNPTG
jgi:hypothetical protein